MCEDTSLENEKKKVTGKRHRKPYKAKKEIWRGKVN